MKITITGFSDRISAILIVRQLGSFGLLEAKKIVEDLEAGIHCDFMEVTEEEYSNLHQNALKKVTFKIKEDRPEDRRNKYGEVLS